MKTKRKRYDNERRTEAISILRIDEPDFGCEGRDDGEAAYDEITLVNEQGETCLVRMEEQQVWSIRTG